MENKLTIEELKKSITSQDELNYISKEVWFMNLIRLIKLGFSIDFATKKATEISQKQMALLEK